MFVNEFIFSHKREVLTSIITKVKGHYFQIEGYLMS